MANKITSNIHPLMHGIPPEWANEWGEDTYGPWVQIIFKSAKQRLCWIPPGEFIMGSPKMKLAEMMMKQTMK